MAEYHGESPNEQHKAACHQVIVNGGDHTANNDSQTRDTQSGHQSLQYGEEAAATEEVVQRATYGHRDDRHNDDISNMPTVSMAMICPLRNSYFSPVPFFYGQSNRKKRQSNILNRRNNRINIERVTE